MSGAGGITTHRWVGGSWTGRSGFLDCSLTFLPSPLGIFLLSTHTLPLHHYTHLHIAAVLVPWTFTYLHTAPPTPRLRYTPLRLDCTPRLPPRTARATELGLLHRHSHCPSYRHTPHVVPFTHRLRDTTTACRVTTPIRAGSSSPAVWTFLDRCGPYAVLRFSAFCTTPATTYAFTYTFPTHTRTYHVHATGRGYLHYTYTLRLWIEVTHYHRTRTPTHYTHTTPYATAHRTHLHTRLPLPPLPHRYPHTHATGTDTVRDARFGLRSSSG